jgi:hypothetical protein
MTTSNALRGKWIRTIGISYHEVGMIRSYNIQFMPRAYLVDRLTCSTKKARCFAHLHVARTKSIGACIRLDQHTYR